MTENNWHLVGSTDGIEVEDIVRFDHGDKTFCIYMLDLNVRESS